MGAGAGGSSLPQAHFKRAVVFLAFGRRLGFRLPVSAGDQLLGSFCLRSALSGQTDHGPAGFAVSLPAMHGASGSRGPHSALTSAKQ